MLPRMIASVGCCILLSSNALAAPCAGFTDVDDTSPFCVNVAWMKNRGITLGLTPTLYDPNSPVTRLQMAAFMYRLGFQNAFLQNGNAFGGTARLGTSDEHAVEIIVGQYRAARYEPVPGGGLNFNVIGGGSSGVTQGKHGSTIGGGVSNLIGESYATIGGGSLNEAQGYVATVGGGGFNHANGPYSVVPGGLNNTASGQASFAAGSRANAAHNGCWVWSDQSGTNATSCFQPNEFIARALGGFYFYTAGSSDPTYTGASLAPGTGAWTAYSDRNGKHAVAPVDAAQVLEKVVSMPIATWQWKAEPGAVRHMGPMAQDFHSAFGLGNSDTQIVTIDADGVALAAIQGLNAKLEAERAAKDAEIAALRAELAELHSLKEEVARIRAAQSARYDEVTIP
jgi:Chaperone of endosialidase/S-layer homology domain